MQANDLPSKKSRFGVFLPFYVFNNQVISEDIFARLHQTVLECERLGYDSVWLDDHLMFGNTPIVECWTTLAALAATTRSIRLGTMVTSNAFRNPALTAKMAATVDIVSRGRLEFGVGAGIQEQEHCAFGYPFPKPRIRAEKLRESVEIIKLLWSQQVATYSGKHYQIVNAVCEPKPIQKPHPPLTIGGAGEQYSLRVTALHADRFDFSYLPTLEAYTHKLQVLQHHCKNVGRDFEEIEKSCWPQGQIVLAPTCEELREKVKHLKPSNMSEKEFEKTHFLGTSAEFAKELQPYRDLGVTYFMLFFADLPDLGSLRVFAEEFL